MRESRRRQLFIIRVALRYEMNEQDIRHAASTDLGVAGQEGLVSAFQSRPTKKHLDDTFQAFQLGIDSVRDHTKQKAVDAFLGDSQDIKDIPLSKLERDELLSLGRAPVPPSSETITVGDRHRLLGFRAGRQYAQPRSYLNPVNYKALERDVNEHNRIMRATFNETRGAIISLFPRFAAAHFLTTKAIAKTIPEQPAQPNDAKSIELLRAEVCRENHEDRREPRMDLAEFWSFTDYPPPAAGDEVHFSIERWLPKPRVDDPSPRPPERSLHGAARFKNLNPGNDRPTFRLVPEEVGFMPEAVQDI
ncbi:MAG: hypothetical protein M1813_002342 [Trichoglossum hirsutum]|nr:MAG: hypothetical protein M1813_002342 [Trichoglossum hirsutum]